ncbi:ferritin-like domain-containing protein [Flavimarina sp. Hel_I_48]|uniref:ferritin-like domain-containing protein n=1 Tax=Flavimarina sp. Hel_I_48 TaxID=1392488 RepID=UPI0004DF266E|nr:ferritin-like domain-containing protein [Flavimarina sp. Hel_I_48]
MKKQQIKVSTVNGRNRRQFLKTSGLAVAGSGLLVACFDDKELYGNDGPFDLGGGDLGVLNYAYALEQLEADFYTKVLNGSYWSGAAEEEKMIIQDLYNHELNHRDFLKVAIGANFSEDERLPTLEFDFSSVDFNDRDAVLSTAQLLEDTGVKAYNGAGKIIETGLYLVLAGKIVSVEARHAAAIRSIRGGNMDDFKLFAGDDAVDPETGLDGAENPSVILAAAGGFIVTEFTANKLP